MVQTFTLADLFTDAQPITLRAAAPTMAPRPGLLITASCVANEGHAAAWIRQAAPDTVQVWTVDEADHVAGLATVPAAWERRVTTFLDDALAADH